MTPGDDSLLEEAAQATADAEAAIVRGESVVDETAHLFLADGLTPSTADADATEHMVVREVPFTDTVAMVLSGRIVDSMTITAVLWADRLRRSPAMSRGNR